ncbi:MAG: alpha/beta hydrolase [Hydrogenophaga sp.]|uniref:PGAP1-like alpha/beta domain-containing protein n=1 Tax=Hydrogenophaga sp. TaxID=1904254 RepID=UPI001D884382|nr:alpha/beta hydrolase [Hydrogenophaga sp.]MBX3609347.1 alpha/beta hydrolase [Hydrogenophaga sp.]
MSASPPSPPRRPSGRHLRASDLQAGAQLATQATLGVIGITEGVHQAVRRRIGLPAGALPERAGGLTGRIYAAVRGVAQGIGGGIDGVLRSLQPLLDTAPDDDADSPARAAVVAALNGVLGDRLAALGNPLAQPMVLCAAGQPLAIGAPHRPAPFDRNPALAKAVGSHALVMVHGLCMNDLQWRRDGHDHGEWLGAALHTQPLYLRYNSGLHIATNGRSLAALLQALSRQWPAALEGITLVGHSMGGLVARSAVHEGLRAGHGWPGLLKHLVFLGTPHHGAPLERAGHGADLLLASSPFSAPLARLGRLRSAGITDLRYGHLRSPDDGPSDAPVGLPPGVACFGVAACLAPARGLLAERLVGDGLVPLRSARGEHDDPARRLRFARESLRTVYRTGHLELLSSPAVADQLRLWLSPPSTTLGAAD